MRLINRLLRSIVLIVALSTWMSSLAQKSLVKQDLIWLNYGLKVKIGENWHFKQDIHERAYWFPWRQHQLLVRSSMNRSIGNGLTVGGGFCYFLQSQPQTAEVKMYADYIELRPHLSASLKKQVNPNWTMDQRMMLEFRFFEDQGAIPYSNSRIRYLLKGTRSLNERWSVNLFDELHMNIGNEIVLNTFDQNRLGGGFNYKVSDKLKLGLTYFNWYQQSVKGTEYIVRDIVQVSLNQSF